MVGSDFVNENPGTWLLLTVPAISSHGWLRPRGDPNGLSPPVVAISALSSRSRATPFAIGAFACAAVAVCIV